MATYEELMAKARELAAAGRVDEAKRVAQIAVGMKSPEFAPRSQVAQAARSEGLNGEGFILDPRSGAMTSQELQANRMRPNALQSFRAGTEEGAFWGGRDELAGAAGAAALGSGGTAGQRYDMEQLRARAQLEAARRDHPAAAYGGEMLGAAATGGAFGSGLSGAAQGAGLGTRMAASAADSALMGGTYGFLAGQGGAQSRAGDAAGAAALGAGVGAVVPAVGSMIRGGRNALARGKARRTAAEGAPTTAELRLEGDQLYDKVDDAGVQISPDAFGRVRQEIEAKLPRLGYDDLPGPTGLTPKSARVMQTGNEMSAKMATDPTAALPFRSLDNFRRRAGIPASAQDKTERDIGSEIIGKLDDFVQNIDPQDVVAGNREALKEAIPLARDTWARMSRSQMIDDAIENGSEMTGGYLGGTASGIRNQFGRILRNPNLSRGFSDEEKRAMARVVSGGPVGRVVHNLGGGIGTIASTALGAGVGSAMPIPGLGTAAGALGGAAAGQVMNTISGNIARRQAEQVRAIIANGGLRAIPQMDPKKLALIEALMRRNLAVGVGG